jgi:hypothetical protein
MGESQKRESPNFSAESPKNGTQSLLEPSVTYVTGGGAAVPGSKTISQAKSGDEHGEPANDRLGQRGAGFPCHHCRQREAVANGCYCSPDCRAAEANARARERTAAKAAKRRARIEARARKLEAKGVEP